tara:strand:+ start:630 stop:911 length:282 start_codon:yes stop_codon:yes gene_type:complete
MIKNKKPNPLEVFKARQVPTAVPYFEYVNIPTRYNLEGSLSKWIQANLRNRYYIGKGVTLDPENKLNQVITIGFEETKEMSYFMLACPHLKYT